jgi:O-antigen ligase
MRLDARASAKLLRQDGLAAFALGAAAVGAPAWQQGGYFAPAWGSTAFGLLLAAALGIAFRARIAVGALQWWLLAGLGSVLTWTALSTLWSDSVPRTVAEVERTLLYVAAIAALLFLVSPKTIGHALGGILAAVVAVSAYSLASHPSGRQAGNPLSGPLGYWNALGILDALGLLLALGFLLSPRRSALVRLGSLLSVPLLATTLYLTSSRGALVALAAGALVFMLSHPWVSGRNLRSTASVLVAVALIAVGTGLVLTGGPGALIGKTSSAFRAPPAPNGQRSERLLTLSGNFRPQYWHVAWLEYSSHQWLGSGAGTFDLYWDRYRKTIYGARDAHNLYLETLAELGPVGLLLLVVTLISPLLGLRVAQRDPLLAAAAGAYVAFLAQAAVDWDWELPAVTIAGLLCGGALTLARSRERILAPSTRSVALATLAALGIFTAVTWRGNLATRASVNAAAQGHYAKAVSQARIAAHWLPWDSEPWRLLGDVELTLKKPREARPDFRRAIDKNPRDWFLWYELAQASRGGLRRLALGRAASLNPIGIQVIRSAK